VWKLAFTFQKKQRISFFSNDSVQVFSDIEDLVAQCQYSDCSHEGVHGCAVISAVETGELDKRRLKNYLKLQREQEYLKESEWQQRDRHRRFSRMVNQVKKEKYGRR
jgi:ribosome biogenesis GTPase / thiamine phosphate phosphatase